MLARWLGVEATKDISRSKVPRSRSGEAVLTVGKHVFVVETKKSGAVAAVSDAAEKVRIRTARKKNAIPLIVVPYMGEVGRERCRQADVQWLDLSGNARIIAPGLRIFVRRAT